MVTDFAARLQDAIDLGAVRSDLLGTVDLALKPAHVTVWTAPATATVTGHGSPPPEFPPEPPPNHPAFAVIVGAQGARRCRTARRPSVS